MQESIELKSMSWPNILSTSSSNFGKPAEGERWQSGSNCGVLCSGHIDILIFYSVQISNLNFTDLNNNHK